MLLAIAEKLFEEQDPIRWAEYYHPDGRPGHMDLVFECVSERNGPHAVEAKNSISIAYRRVKAAYADFSPRGEEFVFGEKALVGLQGPRGRLYDFCMITALAMDAMGLCPV